MAKKMTAKRQENLDIAERARLEGLPTNGELWPQTKIAVRALWAMEAGEVVETEPEAPKAVKTKVVFEPRSTAVGPRGGDPVKRLRTILATEISGAEWGPAHREAWNTLEGWTLADLAEELGIKA